MGNGVRVRDSGQILNKIGLILVPILTELPNFGQTPTLISFGTITIPLTPPPKISHLKSAEAHQLVFKKMDQVPRGQQFRAAIHEILWDGSIFCSKSYNSPLPRDAVFRCAFNIWFGFSPAADHFVGVEHDAPAGVPCNKSTLLSRYLRNLECEQRSPIDAMQQDSEEKSINQPAEELSRTGQGLNYHIRLCDVGSGPVFV